MKYSTTIPLFSLVFGLFFAAPTYAAIMFEPVSPQDISEFNTVSLDCDTGPGLAAFGPDGSPITSSSGIITCDGSFSRLTESGVGTYTFVECDYFVGCPDPYTSVAEVEGAAGYISTATYEFTEEPPPEPIPSEGDNNHVFYATVVMLFLGTAVVTANTVKSFSL